MIYQIHPNHGQHIAYNGLEAKGNIENGWKTVTEDEFYGKTEKHVDKNPLNGREKLEIQYVARFGKKPHHMMKDSTIKAKLDE